MPSDNKGDGQTAMMGDMASDMESEMGGEMNDDMNNETPMDSMENDSTMKIISQLSDKDKKTVEAYAESLLKDDEDDKQNDESDMSMDNINMEQPVNESFIFTKKQLSTIMENFGPTNDELEKEGCHFSKMKKQAVKNTPFNSPKFN